MELEELKQAWQSMSRQLEKQNALALQSFKDRGMDKVRHLLRPLRWGQRFQIFAGAVLMLFAAPFWTGNLDNLRFATYGLLLHAYGLMLVLTAARNLYLQSELDTSLPVVELQKRLAALTAWRLREAVLYSVSGCFIWIPLVLTLFALMGADVWVNVPSMVVGMVLSGFACLALIYGLVRVPRLRRALEDSSIGRSMLRTQGLLDEIARFERT